MPGKVKVKIIAGRNLPVMDRSSDTTDAYVEIKLGGTTYKTDVCRKSLHPQWNSEWYRFEVDDSELQDEPLQMRLMDHDTYSANDAIGKVYLNLNPLLLPSCVPMMKYGSNLDSNINSSKNSVLSGWIPVYDTMHGIRGEVNVTVKVELFSDFNKFRQSSCGVHFFYTPSIPHGYYAQAIYGFVEELIVSDDPEYKWIDKIRTPRASNEARQTLFFKLSGELQRKIGVKALELGANSVVGYRQCFDLEGEYGIVARGIGTAAFLVKIAQTAENEECNPPPLPDSFQADHHRSESMGTKMSHSPAKLANIASIHRRSSDSDLSVTPKGNSLTGNDRSGGVNHALKPGMILRSVVHQDSFDMLEYPFLTISKYPPGFILHLGGAVSARSVKLLERISNIEEPETRDSWWAELRMEMRSHAKALNCNAVLGYTEICSICEDVCVLSAYGTAAIIGSPRCNEVFENTPSGLNKDLLHDKSESDRDRLAQKDSHSKSQTESEQENTLRYPNTSSCMICHLPYTASLQFRSTALKCCLCRVGKVPEVLITTIDATDGIPILGRGCLVQASVQRTLKDLKGEYNAKQISDGLPFLEYELHRILASKLKIKGMNAIFNLKIRISIGEKMLIGVATGTAMFLTPLQSLTLPKLISDKTGDEKKLADLKKRLKDTVKRNKKIYQIKTEDIQAAQMTVDEELEEEGASLELTLGSKECCLLEVDDPDDAAVIQNLLIEVSPPKGIHLVNTEMVPGLGEMEIVKNLQMFKRIYRSKIHQSCNLNQHFQKLLQSIYFKLRKMVPCAVCDLQFGVDLPEGDEVQICVLGMALGLADSQKLKLKRKNTAAKHDDLIFNLEEVNIPENSTVDTLSNAATDASPINKKVKSPARVKAQSLNQQHIPYRERYGVDITPLTYIPGGKIEKYLGNLNLFLVRETTSIREEGGPSGFIHSFATEVLAIVRAHVTALGGNGMVSYFLTECVLNYNLHKNQGQCLINVGGDVVFVSYFKEE
ncbi:hypothetical protein WA026_008936 [Henosepilachna vigintioctopunctata]|uniref:C2 domain-containing protein n=1 Tax=Henosepilachna vigintioctopunctata TaxID=420089 RepID=A0AAW1V375_9CUCU